MNNRWRHYVKLKCEETGELGLYMPLTKRLVTYKKPDDHNALYCYTMDGFSWVLDSDWYDSEPFDMSKEYPCKYWNKWRVKSPKFSKVKRKRM